MLEYQLDQIKIVDFLLIAKFWARDLFLLTLYLNKILFISMQTAKS